MRGLRQVLKVVNVIGRWPEVAGRQNNSADGEAGTSEKKWRRTVAGQSMEPGMLGRGMMRRPSLCWRVFVHRMLRNAPDAGEFDVLASKMAAGVK